MGQKYTVKPIFYKDRKSAPKEAVVLDIYESALKELFFVDKPQIKKDTQNVEVESNKYLSNCRVNDVWIYYPWRNTLVHSVEEKFFFKLRTARNRDVITEKEQLQYRKKKIGIIGMSIGSVILSEIISTGGPKRVKIADYDNIEVTNLNRMDATLLDVTENKAFVAAKNTWEVDPFTDLHVWNNRITTKNIEEFILGGFGLDIFIDSMDSLELKVRAREICRKATIPCLMATSNGDGVILDVERFDKEPDCPLFNGRLGRVTTLDFHDYSYRHWLKLAIKLVDPKVLTERMQSSILQIGKSISGVPQLKTTVSLGGAAIAFAVRTIANNGNLPSGRYYLNIEEKLTPHFNSSIHKKERDKKTKYFLEAFTQEK